MRIHVTIKVKISEEMTGDAKCHFNQQSSIKAGQTSITCLFYSG